MKVILPEKDTKIRRKGKKVVNPLTVSVFFQNFYQETKFSHWKKEKNNPSKFLLVNNHDRKNLIGQTVVIGHLTNLATICWYKDVEIKLSFFSKTGVKLDEGIESIYENIGPGKTIKFKTRYFAPKGTDSVAVMVLKAVGDITSIK